MNKSILAMSAAAAAGALLLAGCSSSDAPADVTPTVAASSAASASPSAAGIEGVVDPVALSIAFLDTVSVQLQSQMSDGSAPSIGITNGEVTVAGVPLGPVPSDMTFTVLADTSGSAACVSIMGPGVEPPQVRLVRPGGVENVAICPTNLTNLIVAETGA